MSDATLSGRNFSYTLWVQSGSFHAIEKIETGINSVKNLFHNIRRRRSLTSLLRYDERMLHDMGLTRTAIERAVELPLSVNGLVAAKEMAVGERLGNDTYWNGIGAGPAGQPHKYFAIAGIIR